MSAVYPVFNNLSNEQLDREVLEFLQIAKLSVTNRPECKPITELCRNKYRELGRGTLWIAYESYIKETTLANMHFPCKYVNEQDSLKILAEDEEMLAEHKRLLASYNPDKEAVVLVSMTEPAHVNLDIIKLQC
jgi:hypothetical protein